MVRSLADRTFQLRPRIEADDVTGGVVLEVIQATLDATAAKRSYFYVDEFFAAIIVQRRIRSRHRQRRDGRGPSRISRIRQDGWCSSMFLLHCNFYKITFGSFLANFERPVLGCIEAVCCK